MGVVLPWVAWQIRWARLVGVFIRRVPARYRSGTIAEITAMVPDLYRPAIRFVPRHCSWDFGFSGSKYRPTDRNFQRITLPLPPNQVHTAQVPASDSATRSTSGIVFLFFPKTGQVFWPHRQPVFRVLISPKTHAMKIWLLYNNYDYSLLNISMNTDHYLWLININYSYDYSNKEHFIMIFHRFLMRFPCRRSCFTFRLSLPPRSKAANIDRF